MPHSKHKRLQSNFRSQNNHRFIDKSSSCARLPGKDPLRYAVKGMKQKKMENVFLFLFDFNFLICMEYGQDVSLRIEDPVFQGQKVVVGKY